MSILKKIHVVFIFFICFHVQAIAHPIHVSVMNMVINDRVKQAVLSFKFYKNDLSLALSHAEGKHIKIADAVHEEISEPLKNYLKNHVKIEKEQENIFKFDHISYEIEHDICWVNIRFTFQNELEELTITNTLLTEIYHDQTNLVIVSKGEVEHGLMFNYTQKNRVVSFL